MTKTILVTGSAGFIGSHLCEHLVRMGCQVVGVDNFSDFYSRETKTGNLSENLLGDDNFEFVELDVRNREEFSDLVASHKPETIMHLAAMAGVRPSIENPGLYADVNVNGCVSALDAAVKNKVQRFVLASSSSVYGNNKKIPFAEDDPVDHPISPYAASKRAAELLCHSYWHLYQFPITCLRFFTVYGERQRPDLAIAKFFRLITEGKPITVFGDGSSSRDYTYIKDIIEGVCAAWQRNDRFRIYNLGGSSPTRLSELISAIKQLTNIPIEIETKPMQPGDVERTFADLSRSNEELSFQPRTPIREGLAKQWEWFKLQRNPMDVG